MSFFITALIRILEGMFLVGIAGSAVVLALATIEDIRTMLDRDDEKQSDELADVHAPVTREQPTFQQPRRTAERTS